MRLFLFMAFSLTSSLLQAGDWPQWRGENRDGKSTDKELELNWPKEGPKLLWKVEGLKKVGTGYGSPAVVGEHVYLFGAVDNKAGSKEFCTCYQANNGEVVWTTETLTGAGSYLVDWGGGPRATPTIHEGRIYLFGSTGDLTCLDQKTGKSQWHVNVVKEYKGQIPKWGYSESPLVDGKQVVVTPGGKGCGAVALDRISGKLLWKSDFNDDPGYSSMIAIEVGGVRQYLQQTNNAGMGIRAKDGKVLWRVTELNRKVAVAPSPVFLDDHVFFSAGYGAGCELYKLEPEKGGIKATKVYTKNKVMDNHHGGMIAHEGMLYGYSDQNQWCCFDFLKGGDDPVWKSNKLPKGAISYAAGHFFCLDQDKGNLVVIRATDKEWDEVARLTIAGKSAARPDKGKFWAHPVIANGKLYLRDYERLFCYDISKK